MVAAAVGDSGSENGCRCRCCCHYFCRRWWSKFRVRATMVVCGKEEDEVRLRLMLCVLLIRVSRFNIFFTHLHN